MDVSEAWKLFFEVHPILDIKTNHESLITKAFDINTFKMKPGSSV